MTARFEVEVNPELIEFAIDRSGLSQEELVSAISNRFESKYFDMKHLKSILEGKKHPYYSDLNKIDAFIKRGIPFYFLPKPPVENILPSFRIKNNNARLSPNMEIKLREYESLREEINILMKEDKKPHKRHVNVYTKHDNPTDVADYFRKRFEYNKYDVIKNNVKDVFEFIRRNIEYLDIFVFKDSLNYNLSGIIFLQNKLPPLILMNSNEDKAREIFTLLHEFGHYLLNSEEVDAENTNLQHDEDIEFWCNDFAYHFLMNKEIEEKENFSSSNKDSLLDEKNLQSLSRKYKVSKLAFMYRFFKLGIIKSYEYQHYKKSHPYKKKSQSQGGGNYYLTNRDRLSRRYIKLVSDNYSNGRIAISEAFNYWHIHDVDRIPQLMEVI